MLHPTYPSAPGGRGLQVSGENMASLPGIWGHLGFLTWLGDGSLGGEGTPRLVAAASRRCSVFAKHGDLEKGNIT